MWNYQDLLSIVCFSLGLRSVLSATFSSSVSCDWTIFYDKWMPSFEQDPYEGNANSAGVHCLHRCCADPSCDGLAIESSLQYQCYRYKQLPTELASNGESFMTFLRQPRIPRWSILKKIPLAVGQQGAYVGETDLVAIAKLEAADAVNTTKQSEESKLDRKLRAALEPPHTCEWKVYYDTWIPSFEAGEYESSGSDGGVHCLEACCGDPTCTGLALESSEMYQCYRYAQLPKRLPSEGWSSLGDGKWLRSKKSAWSIFVKVEVPNSASPASNLRALPNASQPSNMPQKASSSTSSSGLSYWVSWIVHALIFFALTYLFVTRFAQIQDFLTSAVFAIGKQSNPANDRLLQTTTHHQASYTSCGSTHPQEMRAPWAC